MTKQVRELSEVESQVLEFVKNHLGQTPEDVIRELVGEGSNWNEIFEISKAITYFVTTGCFTQDKHTHVLTFFTDTPAI
jgi:hypothetical protein